jgi:alpha-amylase
MRASANIKQPSYYHPYCSIDDTNVTSIKVCWEGDNTVSLPDLRTEDSDVLAMWNSWVTPLVSKYGIDGIRLDSTQNIDTAFLPAFESAGELLSSDVKIWKDKMLMKVAGVCVVGEVFNGDPSYVCPYQEFVSGVLNYPA